MDILSIIVASLLEIFWVIGLILCIKDDIYWEDWGTFTAIMSITNVLAFAIYLKYF